MPACASHKAGVPTSASARLLFSCTPCRCPVTRYTIHPSTAFGPLPLPNKLPGGQVAPVEPRDLLQAVGQGNRLAAFLERLPGFAGQAAPLQRMRGTKRDDRGAAGAGEQLLQLLDLRSMRKDLLADHGLL